MQPNIAMKFVEYVVWIILCKHCKFGKKITKLQRYQIFPRGLLFWCAL